MRKNFGPKSLTYPEPVFIIGTYDKEGKANAMNAAWGGIYDTNQIFLSFSSHKTTDNFKLTNCFTVSFGTRDTVLSCDYVGIVSGNKEPDKVAKAGLTAIKSEFVNAPYFKELPVSLDCKIKELKEDRDGIKVIADILNVSADESVLENGRIDAEKLSPLTYDPSQNKYFTISEFVDYAFKSGLKLK
jgi:flavin reductase (DIM6/NTAB) family NADH-FMN oxidoreductase RutF